MTTAIGPQSANLTTIRPAVDAVVSTTDTWFKDCSSAAAMDGTVLDQSFLNGIVAQLRTAIRAAVPPIPLSYADDTMLAVAIDRGGVAFTSAAVAPATGYEKVGDIWFDTTDLSTNIYASDGTTSSFVQVA